MPEPAAPPPPSPAGESSPPHRACPNHAGVTGQWECDTCEAWLCDDCVRVFATRDGKVACCKTCGDVCVNPDQAPRRGSRGGAVEDETDRHRRYRRDFIFPAVVLALGLIAIVSSAAARANFHGGIGGSLLLFLLSAGALVMATLGLMRFGGVDFGDDRVLILKAAAIAALLQSVRLMGAAVTGLDVPGLMNDGIGFTGFIGALGPILQNAMAAMVSFVILPVATLGLVARLLYELDLSDAVTMVAGFFFVETVMFALLMIAGM